MRRRELLAAGAASVGGVSSCTELSDDEYETYSLNEYSFAGVAVVAYPTTREYQPFVLTAKLRSDGEIVTEKSTTVQDVSRGVGFIISEEVSPHTKYAITVTGPDATQKKATDELRRGTEEHLLGERVVYSFRYVGSGFMFQIGTVSDDWPESGVDL